MLAATVKCVVWDLDDTVWDGVLLEGDLPVPRPAVVATITELDGRGILHAAASRGDHDTARAHLRAVGLEEYFVHLEVGWGAKSESVRRAAQELNLGLDTFAFVDNDPSERDEVASSLPEVRCYPDVDAGGLPERDEFRPEFVTSESAQRRRMYQADRRRRSDEERTGSHSTEFLAGLDLVMTIRPAGPDDLARAHELTVRTHQLNTTGQSYSMDELRELCRSDEYEVLVASLEDRYGQYGTIGLSVVQRNGDDEVLRLLLMSCRVMSRGVGGILLEQIVARAQAHGRRSCAEFRLTPVNRVMLVTLRFAGFAPVPGDEGDDGPMLLAHDPDAARTSAKHVRVMTEAS